MEIRVSANIQISDDNIVGPIYRSVSMRQ